MCLLSKTAFQLAELNRNLMKFMKVDLASPTHPVLRVHTQVLALLYFVKIKLKLQGKFAKDRPYPCECTFI